MRSKLQKMQDWLAGIDVIRAGVIAFLTISIGLGAGWANLNNRIDNNAADIKVEATQRQLANQALTTRLDRGFDKVLDLVKEVRVNQDNNSTKASDDRANINSRLGRIEGQLDELHRGGR